MSGLNFAETDAIRKNLHNEEQTIALRQADLSIDYFHLRDDKLTAVRLESS